MVTAPLLGEAAGDAAGDGEGEAAGVSNAGGMVWDIPAIDGRARRSGKYKTNFFIYFFLLFSDLGNWSRATDNYIGTGEYSPQFRSSMWPPLWKSLLFYRPNSD